MIGAITDSIAVVILGGPFLAMLSILVFEVPRYLASTFAISLFGKNRRSTPDREVAISVVIPVRNGAGELAGTVLSLRSQSANIREIIVIDDGSSDGTLEVARDLQANGLVDHVIHHLERTGKSAAINHAARFATGELLLNIDSDTLLEGPDAVAELAGAFDDPTVAAASGNILVRNTEESLWTSFQGLEYLASITAGRSFLDIIDSIACCSGAFSMFRREVFLGAGGMNVGPGEDLEITLRLRRLGYRIRFVPQATAATRVPTTLPALARQRLRWDRDAVSTRLFMYGALSRGAPRESMGDVLQRLDFMVFEFYPSLLFLPYCIYVLYYFGPDAGSFFLGIYVVLFGLYVLNLSLVVLFTRHRLSLFDAAALLAMPLYQGLIIRSLRFYAFCTEVMFSASRRDDFVPERVRTALYGKAAR